MSREVVKKKKKRKHVTYKCSSYIYYLLLLHL
jgi:hypothetical protein